MESDLSPIKGHFCQLCDQPFATFAVLRMHIIMNHTRINNKVTSSEKWSSLRKQALNPRQKERTNPKKEVEDDEKKVEIGDLEKLYHKCDFCEKCFNYESNLKIHAKKLHARDIFYKCTSCAKLFKTKFKLKIHAKILHPFKKINKKGPNFNTFMWL